MVGEEAMLSSCAIVVVAAAAEGLVLRSVERELWVESEGDLFCSEVEWAGAAVSSLKACMERFDCA